VSQGQPVPSQPIPPVPEPSAAAPGLFDLLLDLFVEPRAAFAVILQRPGRFWIPLLGTIVLQLVFTSIWMQKVDAPEFIRHEIEQSGRADQIPPDQMNQIVDQQARFMKVISPISAIVAPPLFVLVLGGLFLFVYRFFYSSDLTFTQSLAIVAWSGFALALVTIPIMLAIYAGKGDWNVNPQSVVQANLSLVLDRETTSRPLWSLAESIDLFSAWMIFLLASGYGLASRKPTATAVWGILVPWAIWVVGKVGLVALMT
jgi:hypothetical protein